MLGSFAQTLPLDGKVASSEEPKVAVRQQNLRNLNKLNRLQTLHVEPSELIFMELSGLGCRCCWRRWRRWRRWRWRRQPLRRPISQHYRGRLFDEFNYQSMLGSINALSLNDYGYSGEGVRVAVVDSGIDSTHPEFDGK